MNNLRDIVRRHVEKQTLNMFLKGRYETTPVEEKERLLNNLRSIGAIDSEVDNVVNIFVNNLEARSPRRRRRKSWSFAYASLNVILTALITYTAKQELWPLVGCIAATSVIVHGIFIFFNE